MAIHELNNGEKEYLNDDYRSVKKWHYDHLYNSDTAPEWARAQLIDDTYFNATKYPHSCNVTYTVQTYTWNYNNIDPNDTEITLYRDLSDKVVSVSYNCDCSSYIKTSASVTLAVPPDDDFWYMNREYDVAYSPVGSGGQSNRVWIPQLYYIEEHFSFVNDVPTVTAYPGRNYHKEKFADFSKVMSKESVRVLGFFLPESGSYTYDETTSELTLNLQGLSIAFTPEMGGGIVTPISSFNYYFDMPYNNKPTQILAYRVDAGQETETAALQCPVTKTKEQEEKEFVRNDEKDFYQSIQANVNRGRGITFGTAPIVNKQDNTSKRVNVAMPLSISGTQDGLIKLFFGIDIAGIIFSFATCRQDAVLNKWHLPLTNFYPPQPDSEMTSKSIVFPNGWEFENGTSIMTIAEKMLSDKYLEPMLWVDEERRLCVDTRAAIPTDYREYIAYRHISDLIISEDISMDDSNFYTVTEVYGKDGEYYGVYDASFDSFKTVLGNTASNIQENMTSKWFSVIPKVQVINDDTIESDKECLQRAIYETWRSTRGHTKITVKLQDNMIFNTAYMSHIVGKAFVEYRTIQDNGKTLLCNLEKASLNDGVWTWELTPFFSYASSYDWLGSGTYARWKTEHYDEWIGCKYDVPNPFDYDGDGEPDDKGDLTYQQKNTLAMPVILGWEIKDGNILRLYISSIDIGISVVKMWTNEGSGAYNASKYIGESVDTDGTSDLPWNSPCAKSVEDLTDGQHIYKVFDYPITQNGRYCFVAELYSPYHESNISSQYWIDITGVNISEGENSHAPYLTDEMSNKLTDELNNKLTI